MSKLTETPGKGEMFRKCQNYQKKKIIIITNVKCQLTNVKINKCQN